MHIMLAAIVSTFAYFKNSAGVGECLAHDDRLRVPVFQHGAYTLVFGRILFSGSHYLYAFGEYRNAIRHGKNFVQFVRDEYDGNIRRVFYFSE